MYYINRNNQYNKKNNKVRMHGLIATNEME